MKSSELKTIRSKSGLSQDKLSKKLGVSHQTVQAWETNVNPIPEWGSNLIKLTLPKCID